LHVEDCQIELKRIIQKIALYWKWIFTDGEEWRSPNSRNEMSEIYTDEKEESDHESTWGSGIKKSLTIHWNGRDKRSSDRREFKLRQVWGLKWRTNLCGMVIRKSGIDEWPPESVHSGRMVKVEYSHGESGAKNDRPFSDRYDNTVKWYCYRELQSSWIAATFCLRKYLGRETINQDRANNFCYDSKLGQGKSYESFTPQYLRGQLWKVLKHSTKPHDLVTQIQCFAPSPRLVVFSAIYLETLPSYAHDSLNNVVQTCFTFFEPNIDCAFLCNQTLPRSECEIWILFGWLVQRADAWYFVVNSALAKRCKLGKLGAPVRFI
jgi:hypothetical protein